jgi:hypothetical protein
MFGGRELVVDLDLGREEGEIGEGRVDGQDILTITNGITNKIISFVALLVIMSMLLTCHYTDNPV